MRKNRLILSIISLLFVTLVSCDQSDLVYKTSQKHTLYFDKGEAFFGDGKYKIPDVNIFSFAYYTIKDTIVNIPIKYVGMPVNREQTVRVKVISDTIGVAPDEGVDFEFVNVTFPSGKVETNLQIRLKRSETLKDTVYGISLVFEENEIFKPYQDTFYKLQVSDGDLPMPSWWSVDVDKPENRFLGKYYPEKYKMMLERFKAMESKFPDFYRYSVDMLGEFLNDVSTDDRSFYFYKYSAIWGSYIFQPVWDYFTDPANVLPGDDISKMANPVILYK